MLNFDIFGKVLRLGSKFYDNFSRKIYVMFYSRAKFHCLTAFSSCDIGQCVYCIVIISLKLDDVINFEINFSFHIWTKTSGQKSKYLKKKNSF